MDWTWTFRWNTRYISISSHRTSSACLQVFCGTSSWCILEENLDTLSCKVCWAPIEGSFNHIEGHFRAYVTQAAMLEWVTCHYFFELQDASRCHFSGKQQYMLADLYDWLSISKFLHNNIFSKSLSWIPAEWASRKLNCHLCILTLPSHAIIVYWIGEINHLQYWFCQLPILRLSSQLQSPSGGRSFCVDQPRSPRIPVQVVWCHSTSTHNRVHLFM